jgi:hypothetical protein
MATRVRWRHSDRSRNHARSRRSREARSLLIAGPVLTYRQELGKQPTIAVDVVGDVGAVPRPVRVERAAKISRPLPIPCADDFIGEEDTLEKF